MFASVSCPSFLLLSNISLFRSTLCCLFTHQLMVIWICQKSFQCAVREHRRLVTYKKKTSHFSWCWKCDAQGPGGRVRGHERQASCCIFMKEVAPCPYMAEGRRARKGHNSQLVSLVSSGDRRCQDPVTALRSKANPSHSNTRILEGTNSIHSRVIQLSGYYV